MGDSHDKAKANGLNGSRKDENKPNGYHSDGGESAGPDAMDWIKQEKEDDELMKSMLTAEPGQGPDLSEYQTKEFDQTEKADDAVDYEDIDLSDMEDDADDEPNANKASAQKVDDEDDLFGDAGNDLPPTSPVADTQPIGGPAPDALNTASQEKNVTDEDWNNMSFEERFRLNFPQQEPNSASGVNAWVADQTHYHDPSVPAPPQNVDELLEQTFPSFAPHKVLYFRELFAEWPAEYGYKEPPKSPPDLVPTKLELELDGDCSKLFRIPDSALAATQKRTQQQHGEDIDWSRVLDTDDAVSDSEDENEPIGGYTLNEIATVCDDWDDILEPKSNPQTGLATPPDEDDKEMDDWDKEFLQPKQPKKKRKFEPGLPSIISYDASGIDNFLEATRRSGRRVQLDLNDTHLHVVDSQSERPNKRPRREEKTKRMANGQFGRDIMLRFNMSNDDAYNALKANNKSKVRATLSNLQVEHSMPALKLTFPFYRTKLEGEFWEHHRKKFDVEKVMRYSVGVRKPSKVRRKDTKGRSVQDLFKTSKDLSLNDNSTVVLFEYSEQNPIMLSNFGMGSRVINYYRRKDRQDEEKPPKLDIGEPHILLPEDRSPFTIFGTVDPGETVPAIHNEMYRAPIFKHEIKKNDFLLGYSMNVAEGSKFYLKAIDHMYVVGQTFPSLTVPGPHARQVTNTVKNRLKMIAYRMMRKRPNHDVTLIDITPHVFERHDNQNRQKMKEFLAYDRDSKSWVLPEGQTLMEEAAIRAMIKPEDVCMIEAMQIGVLQLQNAGYDSKTAGSGEKDHDDDDAGAERPLVAKLTPWEITKNFIDASAGKAMVALHGEGDPTGHGLGFSFIKTSMKGGYINAVQGPLSTSADWMERERKANGGHSYNVKKQQDMYNAAIQDIWARQKTNLSDATTYEDSDVLDTTDGDERFNNKLTAHEYAASHIDDGRSQFSRTSVGSRLGKKKIRIVRRKRNEFGEVVNETVEVTDPAVIRSYLKQRKDAEEANRDVYSLQPTGDADADRDAQKLVDKELQRLLKNADRRQIREKQGKGKKKSSANLGAGSPDPSGSADKAAGGTTRKCANCGQVGHIKTNKTKCPMLNGTMAQPNSATENGGFGSFSTPSQRGSFTGST